jgi:hypothetical protein
MSWIRNTVNNVGVVYLTQVSLLLIGQQDLEDFFRYRSALSSHWLVHCANFTPTPGENINYSANHS